MLGHVLARQSLCAGCDVTVTATRLPLSHAVLAAGPHSSAALTGHGASSTMELFERSSICYASCIQLPRLQRARENAAHTEKGRHFGSLTG